MQNAIDREVTFELIQQNTYWNTTSSPYVCKLRKSFNAGSPINFRLHEGVEAQWCNSLTLQPEQSGGVGSIPGRAPQLERHDRALRTRFALSYICDPSAWR